MILKFFILIITLIIIWMTLDKKELFNNFEACYQNMPRPLAQLAERDPYITNLLCDPIITQEGANNNRASALYNNIVNINNSNNDKIYNDLICLMESTNRTSVSNLFINPSSDVSKRHCLRTTNCVFDENLPYKCRSRYAADILRQISSGQVSTNLSPGASPTLNVPPVNNPTTQLSADNNIQTQIVQGDPNYSDNTCIELEQRGFEVGCTYDPSVNKDHSEFHLDREIDTMKKRLIFFDN